MQRKNPVKYFDFQEVLKCYWETKFAKCEKVAKLTNLYKAVSDDISAAIQMFKFKWREKTRAILSGFHQ